MQIVNSTPQDLDLIFRLYDAAIAFQKENSEQHWQPFDRQMVATEIVENRQWKVMDSEQVAAVLMTTFEDADIWGDNAEPSIYLHRIVTDPQFRGRNLIAEIINWARVYGKENGKKFIRMDTWSDNQKLIDYYVKCGFTYLGTFKPVNSAALPKHYEGISLAFFEMPI